MKHSDLDAQHRVAADLLRKVEGQAPKALVQHLRTCEAVGTGDLLLEYLWFTERRRIAHCVSVFLDTCATPSSKALGAALYVAASAQADVSYWAAGREVGTYWGTSCDEHISIHPGAHVGDHTVDFVLMYTGTHQPQVKPGDDASGGRQDRLRGKVAVVCTRGEGALVTHSDRTLARALDLHDYPCVWLTEGAAETEPIKCAETILRRLVAVARPVEQEQRLAA